MITFLPVALALASLSTATPVADDGGFGRVRFANQSASALGAEYPTPAVAQSDQAQDPSTIEPASGEEDVTPEPEPTSATGQDILVVQPNP